MNRRAGWLSVCLMLATALPALAQGLPMSPELKAFLTRPDEQQQFGGMMMNVWRFSIDNCPQPAVRGMNVLIGVAPKFDKSGMPVSGDWRVVGDLEGCGKTRRMNVLYRFGPDGRMVRLALLPGTSAADPRLQQDALTYAGLGMIKLMPKDCKSHKVTDTKFIRFEGAAPPTPAEMSKRGWIEEWTVRACGVSGIVTMNFRPDATGTQITTQADKTRPATD